MQLQEIGGLKDFLAHKCRYPGEIYDLSGFGIQLFEPEDECVLLGETKDPALNYVAVLAASQMRGNIAPLQILIFYRDDEGSISSAVRIDATKHNVASVKNQLSGRLERFTADEYEPGAMTNGVKKTLEMWDVVIRD